MTGIGGLFFRSCDPQARATWYREFLGIQADVDVVWSRDAGMTVFAPFPKDSDYFASAQPFMLNLRVTALDDLIPRLEAAGIPVERRAEWETDNGCFVRIHDPEGLRLSCGKYRADAAALIELTVRLLDVGVVEGRLVM